MNHIQSDIVILMSTYNGARFLDAQIQSILEQKTNNWVLWIRDDGSVDETKSLIERWMQRDSRIQCLEWGSNIGYCASFFRLMQWVKASSFQYIFFADQDDVWLPNKLERLLAEMHQIELVHSDSLHPVLIHSDLQVVDEECGLIAPSLFRYQKLFPKEMTLSRQMVHNAVTGCAMLINRPLLELGLEGAEVAVVHDWWLSLVALLTGSLQTIDEPLVLYRQHQNTIGAQVVQGLRGFGRLHRIVNFKERVSKMENQLVGLYQHYPTYWIDKAQGDYDAFWIWRQSVLWRRLWSRQGWAFRCPGWQRRMAWWLGECWDSCFS